MSVQKSHGWWFQPLWKNQLISYIEHGDLVRGFSHWKWVDLSIVFCMFTRWVRFPWYHPLYHPTRNHMLMNGDFKELDDGIIYRKTLYLMVKSMVSCRFSLKTIQWSMKSPSCWNPIKDQHSRGSSSSGARKLPDARVQWTRGAVGGLAVLQFEEK